MPCRDDEHLFWLGTHAEVVRVADSPWRNAQTGPDVAVRMVKPAGWTCWPSRWRGVPRPMTALDVGRSVPGMARKPWRCPLGPHAYVRAHPEDERSQGPNKQVCRRCGKRTTLAPNILPGASY